MIRPPCYFVENRDIGELRSKWLLRLHGHSFDGLMKTVTARVTEGAQHSETVMLHCAVRNRSNAPAYHVVVDFLVDWDLLIPFQVGPFKSIGERDEAPDPKMRIFRRVINSPPDLPIFKEGEVEQHSGVVAVQIPFEVVNGGVIPDDLEAQVEHFTNQKFSCVWGDAAGDCRKSAKRARDTALAATPS
jgi:hypothetical protein